MAEPTSKPYLPYRTDPRDHPFVKHRIVWDDERSVTTRSKAIVYNPVSKRHGDQCPLQFTLGVSRRAHHRAQNSQTFSIVQPPIIHPIFPARGPGRQILHNTLYEHLDLLSPELASTTGSNANSIIKEGLIQHQEFPLLFESSSFAYTTPIIHDVNGDGIPDAILSDYDGGIYMMGLHAGKEGVRWFHKAQVPRIFVRRTWVESRVNETYKLLHPEEAAQIEQEEKEQQAAILLEGAEENREDNNDNNNQEADLNRDPYHSYFEYASAFGKKDEVLRGVTANVLGQRRDVVDALKGRRSQKRGPVGAVGEEEEVEATGDGSSEELSAEELGEEETHRRLLEAGNDDDEEEEGMEHLQTFPRRRLQEVESAEEDEELEISFPRRRLQEVDAEQQERERREQEEREQQQRQREEQERQGQQEQQQREEQERQQQQQQREEQERQQQEREHQEQEGRERQRQQELEHQEEEERGRLQQQERERQEQQLHEEQERQQQQERERQQSEEQNKQQKQPDQQEIQAEEQQQEQEQKQPPEEIIVDNEQLEQQKDETGKEEQERSGRESGSQPDSRSGRGGGTWVGDDDDIRHDDAYNPPPRDDDTYPDHGYGDDVYGGGGGGYDDYYGRYKSHRDDYYDEKHYMRINPHILATPTLAEIPKLYGQNDEVDDVLFVPVSFYLDEDEYEGHMNYRRFEETDPGDETEVRRGMYVASAIMIYQLGGNPRWGRQEHLDLSTDHSAPQNVTLLGKIPITQDVTRMGAFAMSRPVVADIDGDGKPDLLIGTSMGIVYAFDATHMTAKENWPIQMQYAVESPVLVEDVAANTKLETFVSDIGGNVACFDEDANKVWHRDLHAAVSRGPGSVRASSPMTLGDLDGDGSLDIVIVIQVFHEDTGKDTTYIFAVNAVGGKDLQHFPFSFETPASLRSIPGADWVHQQLQGILVVDLHSDQSHIQDYIRRNGTKWEPRARSSSLPGGGSAPGLHVVFPMGEELFMMEAGSGCIQTFDIGEEMVAMVQVDDVHGTNSMDLVVSTTAGNIITMEASAPHHPLNVWNNGEMRGRMNTYSHGFSASQGIFVHAVSREYRDIFGVFVPVTFEIFDNRPNIANEPEKRVYKVEIRDGTSTKRAVWREKYNMTGVYTERVFIPHGAGYYALTVLMRTSNGIVYEDTFHVGYNVNYMDGFGLMIWLPLLLAAITIFLGSSRNIKWDDDDYESNDRNGGGLGILG